MVKLVCNAHTDVVYGFGNEVALMAHTLGLDAGEVIAAANQGYPRPAIAAPGYVGGSCLVKDPYLLSHSVAAADREPLLVAAARQLNESVPRHVAERVMTLLAAAPELVAGEGRVLVSGLAYKGSPATDDTRGNAAGPLIECLRGSVRELRGHDYVVPAARIEEFAVEPVTLAEGFRGAHAAVLLNDHPAYREEDPRALIASMRPPRVVYDLWGLWRKAIPAPSELDCAYLCLGHD
jgi:UDP-N-acetyl-D-mannosaminuronic acid dehydrogenase